MVTAADSVKEKSRIQWIDAAKGFTAILVVLGHDLRGLLDENLITSNAVFWARSVNWLYSFHMFLFFFLSGFLFNLSTFAKNMEETERVRKYRIHVMDNIFVYLVFSALFWLARFVLSSQVTIQVGWMDLIKIPIVPLVMFWYLWVLIVYQIIGFHTLRYFDRHQGLNDLIWLFLFLLLSFVSSFLRFPELLQIFYKVAFYSIAFFTGVYCCRHKPGFLENNGVFCLLCCLSLVVTAAIFCTDWFPYLFPIQNTLVALLLSVTFICIFRRAEEKAYPGRLALKKLGKYALEIYLFQHYIIGIDRRLIVRFALPVNAVTILISTMIETVVPVLIGVALEKMHLRKLVLRPFSWYSEKRIGA